MNFRTCSCGSGREKYAKYDGHGIFLTYVCDKCVEAKMQQYRPDIDTHYEADEPIDGEIDDDDTLHYEDGAVGYRYSIYDRDEDPQP
ncbi:hypothetical protein UFOVP568_11 [uncultured Caudovirales phage]|uniref:Uncharacterized protein n=1 Tax=uncultured Caudovirales phage TaxID=2100421 RepID=A0A6J5MWQ6_9CAUD|nr:hypothetical protein UFOVP568_11 [uncultured Caudovirales phage]